MNSSTTTTTNDAPPTSERFPFQAVYRITINAVSTTKPIESEDTAAEEKAVYDSCDGIVKGAGKFFGLTLTEDLFVEVECVTPSHEQKPIKGARTIPLELWVRLKRSSKYYGQGRDSKGKPIFFPVESIFEGAYETERNTRREDGYVLRFNNNHYRLSDVELYVRAHGHMVRIN